MQVRNVLLQNSVGVYVSQLEQGFRRTYCFHQVILHVIHVLENVQRIGCPTPTGGGSMIMALFEVNFGSIEHLPCTTRSV